MKNPRKIPGKHSGMKQVGFQSGCPIAFSIKKAKNMNSLLGLFDLIKEKIVIDRDRTNSETCQK